MKDFCTLDFGSTERMTVASSVDEEQSFIANAQELLDNYIAHLNRRIETTKAAPSTGTGQDELEREALLDNLTHQLHSAMAARGRFCFGRLKFTDGNDHHVGRIGLRGPTGDVVLVDWRAPQAAPFYQATARHPMGLALRRRIATRPTQPVPEVTHVDDETFDSDDDFSSAGASAMEAPRTGRMADILASIAADQDAIIRSPLDQITVVEGGPGTGKTVVALHRAAWLLYTYRNRLSKDAVLVIGPSNVFLRYIDQVLPSLGETDVVLLTTAQLYPDVRTNRSDGPEVARVKGDARMAKVIEAAIAARVRIPTTTVNIRTSTGMRVRLSPDDIHRAARGISRTRHFHAGRDPFLRRLLDSAARNLARDTGHDPDDQDYCQDLIASLVEDAEIRRELNLMWLPTTPEKVIGRLLTDPSTLSFAAAGVLSAEEQKSLLREATDDWTVDDIPLLDEAAFILGPWVPPKPEVREEDYRELQASDAYRITPDRYQGSTGSVAERAVEDREWIYGHVIVDEAQELSAMAWRAVERRASRRSMTIVGDLQQSTHPAGPRTWDEALRWGQGKVHRHTLKVTYRITRQIAEAATALLIAAGGDPPNLTPIRDGAPVLRKTVRLESLADEVQAVRSRDGRNAVIAPDRLLDALRSHLPGSDFGFDDDALDAPVAVLSAQQSKGLEFDCVVLVDPGSLSAQHPRGADVYVAATRATQTLYLFDPIADSEPGFID